MKKVHLLEIEELLISKFTVLIIHILISIATLLPYKSEMSISYFAYFNILHNPLTPIIMLNDEIIKN